MVFTQRGVQHPLIRLSTYMNMPQTDKPQDAPNSAEFIINQRRICIFFAPVHIEGQLDFNYPEHHIVVLSKMTATDGIYIKAKSVILLEKVESIGKENLIESPLVAFYSSQESNIEVQPSNALIQIANADVREIVIQLRKVHLGNPNLRKIFRACMNLYEPFVRGSNISYFDIFDFLAVTPPEGQLEVAENTRLISENFIMTGKKLNFNADIERHHSLCDLCKEMESIPSYFTEKHFVASRLAEVVNSLKDGENRRVSHKYLESIGAIEEHILTRPLNDFPDFYTKEDLEEELNITKSQIVQTLKDHDMEETLQKYNL